MTDKKIPTKPSRRPRTGPVPGTSGGGGWAREFANRLRAKYPGRKFTADGKPLKSLKDARYAP